MNALENLGLSKTPLLMAPLAGVSDHPFRRICQSFGAELTYVEMISAAALIYQNQRTLEMLVRHPSEEKLGVQITGKNARELGEGVRLLDEHHFETIDINMGCPVKKVVKTGCGSAALKDPKLVYSMVEAARVATKKPLSVKIRIGWDRESINATEVARAIEDAGADWLVVHGRTRSDDYSVPVALEEIARVCRSVAIPVIGNGNLFNFHDASYMKNLTGVYGWMVSRGCLGNPFVFKMIGEPNFKIDINRWRETLLKHIDFQEEAYGNEPKSWICMRKHLIWYFKGWPQARSWRESAGMITSLAGARVLVEDFANDMSSLGYHEPDRLTHDQESRFSWDPKWEMDRAYDSAVANET